MGVLKLYTFICQLKNKKFTKYSKKNEIHCTSTLGPSIHFNKDS